MKPQGISIHVAVNEFDRKHYHGLNTLDFPGEDALAMQRLAERAGFQTELMRDRDATCETVTAAIRKAAGRVGSDGILLLTYAGHGSITPDDPEGDEGVGFDQTWCLFDRNLLDDELYRLWAEFKPGARIVVISDSCHSGSVIRGRRRLRTGMAARRPRMRAAAQGMQSRAMRSRDMRLTFANHAGVYRKVREVLAAQPEPKLAATVLLLAAAGEREAALERDGHGLFTRALLDVWNDGEFQDSYKDFYASIRKRICDEQEPRYYKRGPIRPEFEAQRPFTIAPPKEG